MNSGYKRSFVRGALRILEQDAGLMIARSDGFDSAIQVSVRMDALHEQPQDQHFIVPTVTLLSLTPAFDTTEGLLSDSGRRVRFGAVVALRLTRWAPLGLVPEGFRSISFTSHGMTSAALFP